MDSALVSRIDRLVVDSDFSGVVQIADAGSVVYERARGHADRARDVPLGIDTQLAIASGTKAFTALTAMSLVAEGRLSLETSVLAVLAGEEDLVADTVTVRHLLAHTSGIGDYLDESAINDIDDYMLEVPADRLTKPADFFARDSEGSPRAGGSGMIVPLSGMAKEKVTLTLDSENLAALRALVGPRSLSASVDHAIAGHVARLKHLAAVDEWLQELEQEHGPVPPETLEWAGRLVNDWAKRARRRKAG